jgi:periplasmic divalent cation tolerance protein
VDPEFGIVLTTVADVDAARRLADGLLEQRLAACVQAVPIQSAYRWKGAVQHEPEFLLLIKTRAALYPEVEAFLRAHHPYETPEIVRVAIAAGSPDYLRWLAAETEPPADRG